jgi:hypothetical protein
MLLPLTPLLGLAPAPLQRRWQSEWGFAAGVGTALSAMAELAAGALGVVQLILAGLVGHRFLPDWLGWLMVAGPVLFVVGLVRLYAILGQGEPVGSPLGLPFMLLLRPIRPAIPAARPTVTHFDESRGDLVFRCSEQRRDWHPEGILSYRGAIYRLRSTDRSGSGWSYTFQRADGGENDELLRLLPPRPPRAEVQREAASSPIRNAMITALACIAPRDLQQEWAPRVAMRPVWLTVIGAGAESLGGIVNLKATGPGELSVGILVNVFFLLEGLARFALLIATGGPVGSLLGIPLRPWLERLMNDRTHHPPS